MKHLALALLPALLLPAACHSPAAAPEELAAVDTSTAEITFRDQDARLLANRVRVFLADRQVRIEAPDAQTWIVSGPADDVRLIRMLAMAFDGPTLTPEHVGRIYDIEHRDPRLLTNSARGRADWGDDWIVLATTEPRWYVMVPESEVGTFEAVLEVIDRP